MKKNQKVASAKLKAKRVKKKQGIFMPNFELSIMLPHFHGVKEYYLQ